MSKTSTTQLRNNATFEETKEWIKENAEVFQEFHRNRSVDPGKMAEIHARQIQNGMIERGEDKDRPIAELVSEVKQMKADLRDLFDDAIHGRIGQSEAAQPEPDALQKRISEASYRCDDNAGKMDEDLVGEYDNVWLVSFQRGFEQMDVAVFGTKGTISNGDAEEIAVDFVAEVNPDALTKEEMETRSATDVVSMPNPLSLTNSDCVQNGQPQQQGEDESEGIKI
jgi:hypothetical protein